MRPQGYLLLLIAFINFVLGSFVLFRNIKQRSNLYFAIFAISVGLWALGLGAFIFSHDTAWALFWAREFYIAATAIALTFLLFSLNFTHYKLSSLKKRLPIILLPFLAVVLSIIVKTDVLIQGIEYHSWGKSVTLVNRGYIIYVLVFLCYAISGFYIIFSSFNKVSGVARTQLKYIAYGLLIASTLGATFNLFFPAVGNYQYIWVGPLSTMTYIIMVSYAIIRHRLFDIRLLVAKSIAYAALLFSLGIIFGLGIFGVTGLFFEQVSVPTSQRITYTVLAITLAFALGPLKQFFDKLTNRIFYQDSYDPQVFLDEFNKFIVSTVDLNLLLRSSVGAIENNLKSSYTVFAIRETSYFPQRIIGSIEHQLNHHDIQLLRSIAPHIHSKVIVADYLSEEHADLQRVLQKNEVAVLVRLVSTLNYDVEGLGYLLLGPKKSGNVYTKQDVNVIEIIANELVIAVENALRFEEIEKFNATLQEKVDDATKRLRRTNEKLKLMDETKDEFISMASHQLRTPLTSVKGYLSMVLEGDVGKLTDMQRKLLDQAFISSQRMVYLIADLLNVSRLHTGKFVIDTAATNLAEVVDGEVKQLIETAGGRNLVLEYDKPKDFPALMLDETKVRQVIMNFMDNAIYYTPSGGHIKIKLQDRPDSIEFTVTDDGIGVPKREQQHLFNKFFRAGNARKARPDGTGLGLFMAKKVIVAQGGAIIFKSSEGKGSTFGFSFGKAKLKVQNVTAEPEIAASIAK